MTRDYVKEFQAGGGSIKRLAEGAAYGVDKAADRAKRAAVNENRLIEERHVRCVDHCGRSVIVNGLGELIAVE